MEHHAPRYTVHLSGSIDDRLSVSQLNLFGCVSAQRFVIIANDDTVETVIVEENAGELTVTEATAVLALL